MQSRISTKSIIAAQLIKKLTMETSANIDPWATLAALQQLDFQIPEFLLYRYVKILERAYICAAQKRMIHGNPEFDLFCSYLKGRYGPNVTRALVIRVILKKEFDHWFSSRRFDVRWARVENARLRAIFQTTLWESKVSSLHQISCAFRQTNGSYFDNLVLLICGLKLEDLKSALSKNSTERPSGQPSSNY